MKDFFLHPELKGISRNSVEWFRLLRSLIKKKPLLLDCYGQWFSYFQKDEQDTASLGGENVEIGSGPGILKDYITPLVTSDITAGIGLDRKIDATQLPFEDATLRGIFLVNVFHHIHSVEDFLMEVNRVLKPGGVLSIIDIARSPFAVLVFKYLHHEGYDGGVETWRLPAVKSDSSRDTSNQALTWIVFFRDRENFEKKFPSLKLEMTVYLPWLTFVFSGGATKRTLLPGCLNYFIMFASRLLTPLNPLFSLHWYLRIRKISPQRDSE